MPQTISRGASQGILKSATLCRLRMAATAAVIRSTIPIKRIIEGFMIYLQTWTLEKHTLPVEQITEDVNYILS